MTSGWKFWTWPAQIRELQMQLGGALREVDRLKEEVKRHAPNSKYHRQ